MKMKHMLTPSQLAQLLELSEDDVRRLLESDRDLRSLQNDTRASPWPSSRTLAGLTMVVVLLGLLVGVGTVGWASWTGSPEDTVPRLLPYEGTLELDGRPLSGPMDFEFALFTSETPNGDGWTEDSNMVWGPESHPEVPVYASRFTTELGTSIALSDDVIGRPELYLGIRVDGQLLTGRQRLLSSANAINASHAQSASEATGALDVRLAAIENTLIPVGSITAYWGTQAPPGWLMCDGSAIPNDPAFNTLRALTGATVPDLRGMFLRGLNNARTDGREDPDGGQRALGGYQADEFKSHSHSGGVWIAAGAASGGSFRGGTDFSFKRIGDTGGNETRPRNIAVNYIIKH